MTGFLRAPPATGIVLAGGVSSRMNRDKALTTVAGVPMLQRAVDAVAAACTDVLVIGDSDGRESVPLPHHVRWVPDTFPGRGPLAGLHAGLAAAQHDLVFATSCDMPLLNTWLITVLLQTAAEDTVSLYDAIVPRVDDKAQTLHAVYRKGCLASAERLLREEERPGLQTLLRRIRVWHMEEARLETFDPGLRSFSSVNTQEDLERVELLLRTAPS